MTELKPCPFCGSTRAPEVSDVGECEECANFDYCLHRQKNHTCEGCDEWERPMFVVCNYNISGCGVSGPYRKTKAEAIAAWNSRVKPPCDGGYCPLCGAAERTCHIEGSYYDELFDETCTNLSCGHAIWQNESPNYCSECGAKVVSE